MKKRRTQRSSTFGVEQLEARNLLAVGPRITEFMARNNATLADVDGDFSDWIEIRNEASDAIRLNGWYLTDDAADLTKWQFSAEHLLASGDYLVVFASGKDRDTNGEAHTNFQLDGNGEYLALVEPDGATVVSHVIADDVRQRPDISYGETVELSETMQLVSTTSPAELLTANGPQEDAWRTVEYLAGPEWMSGDAGVGFQLAEPEARPANVVFVVNTDVGASPMAGNQSIVDRLSGEFGYEVTVVDDDDVEIGDADGMDLVVISSTVAPNKVDTKFRDVPIPVVLWESGLTDEFELSASGGLSLFQTTIEILSSAEGHPLAAGLSAGEHTVKTKSSILHTASHNDVAPGMTWIANASNGAPAIGVIEAGGILKSGEPAADMRIMSFFGDESLTSITDAALALFDASINYALDGRLAGPDFADHFSTDVADLMADRNASLQMRVPFEFSNDPPEAMLLRMKYDDGFVAYLNGVELTRRNSPAEVSWDSVATAARSNVAAVAFEEIDVSQHLGLLRDGENVLAIQGLNAASNDADFLLVPELIVAGEKTVRPRFYADPTPGADNGIGAAGFVADTQFNVDRGFFDTPFQVEITSATPNAVIRYTTDGTSPSELNGEVYTGPVHVDTTTNLRAAAYKDDYLPTNVDTHTYVFLKDVIQQPAEIAGFPLGGRKWAGDSTYVPQDSQMDPQIVNDPAYATDLMEGLLAIPTMSITTDLNNAFTESGWYDGENIEQAVSVEVLYPDRPGQSEQANAGIESHSHDRLKRSLRLNFRTEYGDSNFVTDLFQTAPLNGETAVGEADRIILRAGNNRSWARIWNPDKTAYTTDQFYRDSQIAMSGYGMRGNFVHLYLNGVYWGLYNPVERSDRFFTADYFGGNEDDWYVANHGGSLSGDSSRWDHLRQTLVNRDMSIDENFEELQEYLDVEGYADYLMISWWMAVSDWPQNNWYGGNRNDTAADGPTPFQFFAWDGEWAWGQGGQSSSNGKAHVHEDFRSNRSGSNPISRIWHAARKNDDFMMMFADRVYAHLNHDGALTEENAKARWTTLTEYVRNAVVAESARWGDSLESDGAPTRTRDVDWQREVDRILGLMTGNNAQFLSALRAEGYYPTLNPASFNQRGGIVPPGFEVSLNNPNANGQIYFTIDGADPRGPGGSLSASALLYDATVDIQDSSFIRTRVLNDGEWSPLNEATFVVADSGAKVAITEINYNPHAPTTSELDLLPGVDNSDFEFVEVTNTSSSQTISLVGMQFVDGVTFAFGTDALSPGESGVVVKDAAAFQLRYGDSVRVLGEWSGGLANGGETLLLANTAGETLIRVTYDNAIPWSARVDGAGATLELVDPMNTAGSQTSKPYSWRGSTDYGGSPGKAGTAPLGVVISEVLTRTDPPVAASDSIELWNPTGQAIDIGGWYLSDSAATLLKYEIPLGTILESGNYIVFDESHFNPTPLTPSPGDFALSGTRGDDAWLVVPDDAGGVRYFVDDVHFGAASNGVSFGRVVDSGTRLVPLNRPSPGCENAHHLVGSLVISEAHYNSPNPSESALAIDPSLTASDLEYIEIHNPTTDAVELTNWRIRGGVDMDFDSGATIGAGRTIVITRFDPVAVDNSDRVAAFRNHYGIDAGTELIGGYGGSLSDTGERVTLLRPDEPSLDDPTLVPHVIEDEVIYDNASPWQAATGGESLNRLTPLSLGDASGSWTTSTATPGVTSFVAGVLGDLTGDGIVSADDIDLLNDTIQHGTTVRLFDLNDSGFVDVADRDFLVETILGTRMGDANLDGQVDALDLNKLGLNWQRFGGCLTWSDGNFDRSTLVDAIDLNFVGINWLAAAARARPPRAALAGPATAVGVSWAEKNEREVKSAKTIQSVRENDSWRWQRARFENVARRREERPRRHARFNEGNSDARDNDDLLILDALWGDWQPAP